MPSRLDDYVIRRVLQPGRVYLAWAAGRRVVLKLERADQPEAAKLRSMTRYTDCVAPLLATLATPGGTMLVVEYLPHPVRASEDPTDLADLLRLLARLNTSRVPDIPTQPLAHYQGCFLRCRLLIRDLVQGAIDMPVEVTADNAARLEGLIVAATAYLRSCDLGLCHGDPTDHNCGRDARGAIRLFDVGLSRYDMWLKDAVLRLGGCALPYPTVMDDAQWLSHYLGLRGHRLDDQSMFEFEMTRRICNLYLDQASLEIMRGGERASGEWAGYVGWVRRILAAIRGFLPFPTSA